MAAPLFASIAQALNPQGVRRSEDYVVSSQLVPPYAGDALGNSTLSGAGLPVPYSEHPNNPNLIVESVTTRPFGPGHTLVSYVYSPPSQVTGLAHNDSQMRPGVDVSFAVFPEVFEAGVPMIRSSPVIVETLELDAQGQPTGTNVIAGQPAWSQEDYRLESDRARINYTIAGTAAALGIVDTVGSTGEVPGILNKSRTIHDIGGLALMLRGIDLTWRYTTGNQKVYTIGYEWIYEAGIQNSESNMPDGWIPNPAPGPGGDRQPILNARGTAIPNDNLLVDALESVATPDVLAPPALRGIGHVPSGDVRYSVVPYCDVRVQFRPGPPGGFSQPEFVAVPRFSRVDVNGWLTFPGVGGY